MCSTLSPVGRHLCSIFLLVALAAPGVALAQGEGAGGLDAPPGSVPTPPTTETRPEAPPAAAEQEPAPGATPGAAVEGEPATEPEGQLPPPTDGEGDPATEGAAEPSAEAPAPPGGRLQIIVIDAAPHGVAPVVGRHVTERMRITAREMGYEVVSADETLQAAQRMQMPYPPSPADLWRVTYVSRSQRGAFAKVWAHDGQYVFEISIASLDGAGPFFARGTSGAEDLHEVVEQLTREALPSPESFDVEAAERYTRPQAVAPPPGQPAADQFRPPPPRDSVRVAQRRVSRRPKRRWDLALQAEGAFGTSSDFFYNQLIGLRLGFRITHGVHLGLYGAYANLRGRDQRESNLLPMLQLTNRIRVSSRSDLTVPIRASVGYLPFNGPVIRLSAGLNIPVTDRIELGADILVPTFWFLGSDVEISLNVGLELIYRL